VQGDGWYKDETGYHYTEPAVKLDEAVVEEAVIPAEEPVIVEEIVNEEPEQVVVEEIVEVAAPEEPAPVADAVAEVSNDYLPPKNEYLPPKPADAKKKRQIQVRKVYRRFVKKH
jgi:hypothetical protein